MKFARRDLNVIYFTQTPIEKVPACAQGIVVTPAEIASLRNISLHYCKTLPALLKSIHELQNWHNQPSLVILESLHTYFLPFATESEAARDKGYTEFTENHALVISSLLNSVENMLMSGKTPSFSVITTDFNSSPHYNVFKKLLIDLYYSHASSYYEHCDRLNELEETFNRLLG